MFPLRIVCQFQCGTCPLWVKSGHLQRKRHVRFTPESRHVQCARPCPLGHQLLDENIDARRITAGPGEAGDKTELDRVIADTEDDRDRRCCSFSRKCGRR